MAPPMILLTRITYPFIWLLTKSTNALVKIFNIKMATDTQVTEEEIKAIINEGTATGALEEGEQEIIERVFKLGDRNITSLMTHRSDMVWLDKKDSPLVYRKKVSENPHSAYLLSDGQIDNIIGVIYIKDLYLADEKATLENLMKKPLFIPDSNSAYQVLEKYKENKTHVAFIVDEYGSMQGMITMNDVLEALLGELPKQDSEENEIVKREDGSYFIAGQILFYDFLEYFNLSNITEETEMDFDTLAGFLLFKMEHIPQAGEKLNWKKFSFEIADMDGHRIDKVLVHVQNDSLKLFE